MPALRRSLRAIPRPSPAQSLLWLPLAPGHGFANFLSLSTASLLTGLVTTLRGVPPVLTPLAAKLSHASNLPLETVLMTQVMASRPRCCRISPRRWWAPRRT